MTQEAPMSVKDDTRATPEPVAPTSTDIAGLVDRLTAFAAHLHPAAGEYAVEIATIYEASDALQRVAQERDEARLQQKAWADKWDHDLTAAEARISSARDEGLEMAAIMFDQSGLRDEASAIRALKGPKP